jgi:PurA ssDNA and RNA-binding protein
MISNERPSPYGRRPYGQPKPQVNEDTLKSDKVQIERKTFLFTLKENPRGRFLRITEDVGGRRDTIIVPATGLEDFKKLLDDMVKASGEMPQKSTPGA